ncbi:retrovirus-related pol polyprotein from transposon TNT 1-94, partial [Tanacetum coccineum]
DDYSRYTWTLFLRSKDETPEVLKDFLTMIQRNLQAPVISVRTDRGTKFLNKTLNAFFKEEGIEHQTSTPRTPEQCCQLLNFLYSFGLKQSQPHAILKTDQSSSQLMRKRHITSLMTENPPLNIFTSLVVHLNPSISDLMKSKRYLRRLLLMTSVHNSSGLAPPRQMTSDDNSSELGIHDHSNELSRSKLVPKVVPPADKTATSRQELELPFHHHITMLRSTCTYF